MNENYFPHAIPEESYSRKLDMQVQESEMPYGYTSPPPSYDTGDFNMRKSESKKEYPHAKFRG